MLLKDCPVGSVVRLVRFCGEIPAISNWDGKFEVKQNGNGKYVTDGDGDERYALDLDLYYEFEIVTPAPSPAQPKTIYLKGKTYNLIPAKSSDLIEIDGIEYYMEEKK